jgi:hypothetical protein
MGCLSIGGLRIDPQLELTVLGSNLRVRLVVEHELLPEEIHHAV